MRLLLPLLAVLLLQPDPFIETFAREHDFNGSILIQKDGDSDGPVLTTEH